ncbi:MAG TPA: SIS domain-containing protein [Actinomycetota bacterium]
MTTRNFIMAYLASVEGILRDIDPPKLEQIIDVIYHAYSEDRQIFLMGNGGGAATSMHFTCDLNKTAIVPGRRRMRAMSLSDNTSLVTAWANDTNYTNIFGEQLVNWARPGDLVIGFTASGMSVNIVNAIALANEMGCQTIAFVGFDGGTVGAIAQNVLHIQSSSYQHIEDVHLLLCHVITNALQDRARADTSLVTTGQGDEVQERVRRIYYARQQLMTEPSRERRLRMIPDQVRRTIGFDRSMLFVAEDTSLKLLAAYPTTLPTGESIDVEADLFECEAFRDRHAIAVPTANGRSPVWLKAYKDVSSYAVAPIVRDDHSVGLLVGAYTRANREVDASDLQLLQIFAYNIRGALEPRRTDDPLPGGPWAQG